MSETEISERVDEKALNEALSKLQARCGGMERGGKNEHLRSSYSTLRDCWKVIRPNLEDLGLAIVQLPKVEDRHAGVVTEVRHSSGALIRNVLLLPYGGKNPLHAAGSAITYAKRYALMAICGLAEDEHDDDGNAGGGGAGGSGNRGGQVKLRTADHPKRLECRELAAQLLDQGVRADAHRYCDEEVDENLGGLLEWIQGELNKQESVGSNGGGQ